MLDPETITQQRTLLAAHRRTLAHLLQQAAQYGGEVFAPPQTINGIAEARQYIRHTKTTLRKNGVSVEDEPNDKAPRRRKPAQSPLTGDVMSDDKITGDLIAGGDEYRIMLVGYWGGAQGKLRMEHVTSLKAAQIRLRLTQEQAQKLELEVRVALAKESLADLNVSSGAVGTNPAFYQKILCAFRLNEPVARRILVKQIRAEAIGPLQRMATDQIWLDWEERENFLWFLVNLKAIAAAKNAAATADQAGRAADFAYHQVHHNSSIPGALILSEAVEKAAEAAALDYIGEDTEEVVAEFYAIVGQFAAWPNEEYPIEYAYAVGEAALEDVNKARAIAQLLVNSSIEDAVVWAAQAAIVVADAAVAAVEAAREATGSIETYSIEAARTAAEIALKTARIADDVARAMRQLPPDEVENSKPSTSSQSQ